MLILVKCMPNISSKDAVKRLEDGLLRLSKEYGVGVEEVKGDKTIVVELPPPPPPPIVIDVVPHIVEVKGEEEAVEEEAKEVPQREEAEGKKEAKPPTLKKVEELEPDQITFINRAVDALAGNLEGYPKDAQQRAMEQKSEMRRELTEVFQGKRKYEDWFNKTKTQFGLHTYTFTKMLYDCLDGLRSPDAQALRSDYYQALRRLGASTP